MDGMLLFAICFVLTLPVNFLIPFETTSTQLLFTVVIATVACLLLFLTRNLMFGGTGVGHFVTGTRIVSQDGSEPSLKQYLLRELPLLFWPIEVIGVVSNGFKGRFGDNWSGTRVVIDPGLNAWVRTGLGLVLLVGGFLVSITVMRINMSTFPPYEVATKTLRNHPEVKSVTGEVQSFGWLPNGNVNINTKRGVAVYKIKVIGEQSTRWSTVMLINKTDDDWTVQRISLE